MTQGHRREIDGLRAVAVTLVVAFHSNLAHVAGGFIGVDAFFVLSGFLITGLLVAEGTSGRIDVANFYARRARRLLPAAVLAIVGTSIAWLMTTSVIVRTTLVDDARSAALYFANWHFIRQSTDYFAMGGPESPFLHFWSLSAEEQFYIAWPIVLALLVVIARRRVGLHRLRAIVASCAVIAGLASLASLVSATAADNGTMAYFGTQNRVYQLMIGAALACVDWSAIRPRLARLAPLAAPVALVTLLVCALGLTSIGAGARGLGAALSTGVLIAAMTVAPGTAPVTRLLSTRPFVWLGGLSYGIYLWHWPVILLLRRRVDDTALVFAIATVISIALAWLSQTLIERRIRFSSLLQRHHRPVIAGGLAVSLVTALVICPPLLGAKVRPTFGSSASGLEIVDTPTTVGSTELPAPTSSAPTTLPSIDKVMSAQRKGAPLTCIEQVGDACKVSTGGHSTVVVVGDSDLYAFANEFAAYGAEHDLTMWITIHELCPWLPQVVEAGKLKKGCALMHRTLYDELLPEIRPDSIIVLNRAYDDPTMATSFIGPDGEVRPAGDVLVEELPDAVSRVLTLTPRLVFVEPWPSLPIDQRECLTVAHDLAECAATAVPRPLPSDAVIRDLAAADGRIVVVSISDLICPRLPVCDAVVENEVVRTDRNHLNTIFAAVIGADVIGRLVAVDAFEPAR